MSILKQTSPYANTNGQWIARNVIQGFFTAPIEALPEITVTDVVRLMIRPNQSTIDICSTSHTSEALTWVSTPFALLVATSLHLSSAGSLHSTRVGGGCSTGRVSFVPAPLLSCSSSWKKPIMCERISQKLLLPMSDSLRTVPKVVTPRKRSRHLQCLRRLRKNRWRILRRLIFKSYRCWDPNRSRIRCCGGFGRRCPICHGRSFSTPGELRLLSVGHDKLTPARFSYGSYLILFNILNGTASIILSGPPYNFGYVR